jgi:hypothetical protein
VAFLCQAWQDLAIHTVKKSWGIDQDALGELTDCDQDLDWKPTAGDDEKTSADFDLQWPDLE